MIHLYHRPPIFIRTRHDWAGVENGVWWKINNWPTTTKGEAMKKTEKQTEKKIGRREFYHAVLASWNKDLPSGRRKDLNPIQSKLRVALNVLAGYDDATILRLVRGK